MVDNNDARYAHRWLKEGYLEIENWLKIDKIIKI